MFAKIFGQIFDSSIAERPSVRRMFMDMLVLADAAGIVDMTHEAIARRTNVPLPEVQECIAALEQPDPMSRSKAENGKRIVELDPGRGWGWRIVNWDKYRQSATKEMLRMAEAERKAEYRRRHGNKPHPSPAPPTGKTEEVEAEADPSRTCPGQVQDTNLDGKAASESEVLAFADRIGLAPWKAKDWFQEMETCGWLDYQSRPVRNWQAALSRVRVKWEADGRPMAPPTRSNHKPARYGGPNI